MFRKLQEMTDVDTLNDSSEEATESLVNALITNQVSALLIQNMERLNEGIVLSNKISPYFVFMVSRH